MKNFLAVYIGTADAFEKSGWRSMDEKKRKELEGAGIAAWGKWMMDNQKHIVEQGSPVGKTKRIGPQGISDIRNNLSGYTVVRAESHEAAAKLFQNHPHFTLFPGDSVEVMECLPIPRA